MPARCPGTVRLAFSRGMSHANVTELKIGMKDSSPNKIEELKPEFSDVEEEAEALIASIIDPSTDGNRYPLYERLRDIAPIYRTRHPLLEGWYLISGYENCRTAMLAQEAVQNSFSLESMNIRDDGVHDDMVRRWMNFRDDPADHDRLRKLFFRYFTPRAVTEWRSGIKELIDQLLDAVGDKKEVDIFAEFCFPLPSLVIARMLGIPMDDMGRFQHVMEEMIAAMAQVQDLDAEARERRDKTAGEFLDFFRQYLDMRRQNPADDLISKVGISAPEAGVDDTDLLAQFVFLLIAGHSTTADSIGNALIALDQNRDQLQLLLDKQVDLTIAASELMRYDSSIGTVNRYFVEEMNLDGVTIPAGSKTIMLFPSAHRDPGKFENPNRLDLTRESASDAFPFGGGRYFCLGQALAKVEIKEALAAFLDRYPTYRVIDYDWQGGLVSHGPKYLNMELHHDS